MSKYSSIAIKFVCGLVAAVVVYFVLGLFVNWSNDNSGFVSALGLFLVIPFAIWSSRLMENKRRAELAKSSLLILMHELWINLNYAAAIERSYNNNFEIFELENPRGVHTPHYLPRTSIIEKFIGPEQLSSLSLSRQSALIEIYAQLTDLRAESIRWREALLRREMLNDRDLYVAFSSTLVSYIPTVMRNMLLLWVDILNEVGSDSSEPVIKKVSLKIKKYMRVGMDLQTCYRSSDTVRLKLPLSDRTILVCWVNDMPTLPCPIMDMQQLAALHPTWRT